MRRVHPASIWLLAIALTGCESESPRDQPVKVAEVPAAILKVAQEKLPDYKFDRAWKTKKDGKDAYEIQGKNKIGKTRDVCVSTTGEVLEID